jgi:hypothetical protein
MTRRGGGRLNGDAILRPACAFEIVEDVDPRVGNAAVEPRARMDRRRIDIAIRAALKGELGPGGGSNGLLASNRPDRTLA